MRQTETLRAALTIRYSEAIEFPESGPLFKTLVAGAAPSPKEGKILSLWAEISSTDAVSPALTQVPHAAEIRGRLMAAHEMMRAVLNPQPATPPPGPGDVVKIAVYAGLALSQNALNYYIAHQWRSKRFHVAAASPDAIRAVMPAVVPIPMISVIHVWPASAPRIEMAVAGIARGEAPVRIFFDDVRACFQTTSNTAVSHLAKGAVWELSFNFSVPARLITSWSWLFDVVVDDDATATPIDDRTWEWVAPLAPLLMKTLAPASLQPAVDLLVREILKPLRRKRRDPVTNPAAWPRPYPGGPELTAPEVKVHDLPRQRHYLELMAWRKTLYTLSALDTAVLQLVDGSGAPDLNAALAGPPVTIGTMSCVDGMTLAAFIPRRPCHRRAPMTPGRSGNPQNVISDSWRKTQ